MGVSIRCTRQRWIVDAVIYVNYEHHLQQSRIYLQTTQVTQQVVIRLNTKSSCIIIAKQIVLLPLNE